MLQIGSLLVRFQLVPLEFFIDIKSFQSHNGSGVDSASNRNEYQEHLLGGKGGRCVRLTTLPPSCAVVMKSGNLNFLEPYGPLHVYNGTALPLPLHLTEAGVPKISNQSILYISEIVVNFFFSFLQLAKILEHRVGTFPFTVTFVPAHRCTEDSCAMSSNVQF